MDNFTHNDEELLVQYLDGVLDEHTKAEVEKKLNSDTEFRNAYESLLLTKEAVKQYGLKEKVAGIHKGMMKEMQQAPIRHISSARRAVRYTISVAAALIVLIGSFMLYNFYSLSAEKVFNSGFQSYDLSTARGNEEKESVIAKAYRSKRFDDVVKLYEAGADSSKEAMFLTGMSALELKENSKAISNFKMLIAANQQNNEKLYNDDAEYYLSLSYIRNGDYDFALGLLHKIKDDSNHSYNKKVTAKLLRQIKMLKWR